MEKRSPPVGTIKEFLNCSPSWKDHIDLNGTAVKPQCWEVWQQVLLPTPEHRQTDAAPPKTTLDDIQICVVSSDNSPDSFKEKEANTEGMAGMDCVITIEEEIEVQRKSSPESRIERRDDIKICTVPELQEKAPFVAIDGRKTKTFTKPVICTVPELQDKAPFVAIDGRKTKTFTKPAKDRGISKVEKATQTEVTKMEMAKICEDYIQKAKGSKDTLWGNHQANVISQNKPRNSEEGMIHLTEPDRVGEPEEAAYNNLTAGDKGDEEEKEDTGILKEGGIAMEHARQSFRWYCYPECEGPRKAYRQLLDLCRRWLKPERRSKEQILELLVLEQFLATLPKQIQSWVWQQHPENCGQAVELVENFLTGLSLLERHGKKALVTFEEVSLYFSEEEWRLLDESQRKIFTKVMMENYENVRALGFPTNNADFIFKMGRNENREMCTDKIQNHAEGASPKVTGEFSNEKEKLATWRQKDMEVVLPAGPSSPRLLKICDATVKGLSPKMQRARSLWPQILPGFACPDCGKGFFSKSDMARHQWHHSRNKPYQVVSCPRSFAKPFQLAQHQPSQRGECQCSKCGKRFTDHHALAHHQAIHSATGLFHHHCRGFYFNYNLRQNQKLNQQATASKPIFHCPHCGRQFTRRCNLIQHSRIHQYQWQPQRKQEVALCPADQTQ